MDLPACRPGDLADRLPEGQEAWTRNFVELTRVSVLRQRGDRDVVRQSDRVQCPEWYRGPFMPRSSAYILRQ